MAGRHSPTAIVGSASIGMALSLSVLGMTNFGVFIVPLTHAFGWGRGEMSLAYTIMCYTVAALSPLMGLLTDRYGARRVLLPSILLLALALGWLSGIKGSIAEFYRGYGLLAVAGVGTMPLSYARIVVSWFESRRGLALGIALAGVGIGTTLMPPLLQYLINKFGWRGAYIGDAALVLAVSLPLAWIYLREADRPVSRGTAHAGAAIIELPGQSVATALGGRVFWQMFAGFALLGFFTAGIVSHIVPLLRDRGASPQFAANALSFLGLTLVAGRIGVGHLLDRLFAPYVVSVCLAGAALGVSLLWSGAHASGAIVAVFLMGFAIGAELDFMSYLVARYHGLRAYGRIYGILFGAFISTSGLGPLLMGYGQQRTGNYDGSLALLFAAIVLSVPLFAALGHYPDEHRDGT